MDDLPIIDAHHHFWDLSQNKNPWLCGAHQIPFRYGDYTAIRRNYLVDDLKRDFAGHNVVKSVHMETEWDPTDPVGENRWLHELHDNTGWPHAVVGQAWLDRDDIAGLLGIASLEAVAPDGAVAQLCLGAALTIAGFFAGAVAAYGPRAVRDILTLRGGLGGLS